MSQNPKSTFLVGTFLDPFVGDAFWTWPESIIVAYFWVRLREDALGQNPHTIKQFLHYSKPIQFGMLFYYKVTQYKRKYTNM